MRRSRPIRAYPPSYWDSQASEWDELVRRPKNPHQFYYLEADYLISSVLEKPMQALELGCGTGGSTAVHRRQVAQLVATDFSLEMVRRAARGVRDPVRFVVADASHLPFRDRAFDVVFSRGVLLSYVPDPSRTLEEARRVLRPGGKLAMDAMNRISGGRGKVSRLFHTIGDRPAYVEYAMREGRQIRRIHWLSETSPLAARAKKEDRPKTRPRNLQAHVASVEQYEGRLFRAGELKELLEAARFKDVRVTPLGHLAYTLGFADDSTQRFARKHRRPLSKLYLQLADHFRLETAWHLLVRAVRR
ncbi:MAG: class I SAM-dependent methyltransferase [Euryarchaeota archaeon]|nr:class I SAM-dependent methyltransferase [Euryarchaeota archaeon]